MLQQSKTPAYKKIFIFLLFFAFLGCTIIGYRYLAHRICFPSFKTIEIVGDYKCPAVRFNGNYSVSFNDKQDLQISAAKRHGISPAHTHNDIKHHLSSGKLVKIAPCNFYNCIADLPYLTPNAADLLAEIGHRYQEIEGRKKHLRVTSALRTDESVKDLRKKNSNAVKNSCHRYGTTFDISYKYMTDSEKRALAQALRELQSGGHCYVKYEVNQPCFHITSRR